LPLMDAAHPDWRRPPAFSLGAASASPDFSPAQTRRALR